MLDDATKRKVWPGKIIRLACSASGNHDRSAHPKNYPQFRSRRDAYIEKDRAYYGEQR